MCDMSQTQTTATHTADEMISAAVRGLIAQRRGSATRVAVAVGVSRAALYRKLGNASPWQAEEVDRLARFFEVTRDSLYEGRAEFSRDPGTRSAVAGGAAGNLEATSTRSSTDRASDYGSRVGRFAPPRRRGRRNTDRHLSVVPLPLTVGIPA